MAQEVKYLSYSGLSHLKDILEGRYEKKGHTHTVANITDFGSHVYDATISRTKNTVLAAPNGSNGTASFRALVAADLPTHTHSYLPLSGGSLTGPLALNGSDTDRNLIRVNCISGDASQIGNYGYTLKFLGSGTGVNNALALYADNQTATTQNLATKWLNDGTMYGRSILPHTTNTFDLGSSSLKWKNVYATTFTGNLKGSMLSSVSNSSSASITEIPNAIRFDSFLASNTTSGFGSGYNNAILTVGRFETTNYASQIGFSGNGKLYYRSFIGTPLDDSKTWSQIALTSDIPTSLTNTEIDAIFTDLGVTI